MNDKYVLRTIKKIVHENLMRKLTPYKRDLSTKKKQQGNQQNMFNSAPLRKKIGTHVSNLTKYNIENDVVDYS